MTPENAGAGTLEDVEPVAFRNEASAVEEAHEPPPRVDPSPADDGPARPAPADDGDFEAMIERAAAPPRPPRPGLDWIDEADAPAAREPALAPSPADEDEADPADESRTRNRSRPLLFAGLAAILLGSAGLLLLFGRPAPAPTSAALDAERNGPAVPPPTDPILPIDPPAPAGALPAEQPTAADAMEVPSTPPGDEDVLLPVEPASSAGPDQRLPQPSAAIPPPLPPSAAADERLVQIVQQLETHQALIERLERSERILRDRLEGLEIHAQADADTDGTAPLSSQARPPQAPPPSQKRVPPSTTSRPVKTSLQRRADRPPHHSPGSPLPFSVETVDTWNGEPTVVVRSGSRLIDLKPGESRDGWRIEAARGQSVTLIGPDGGERTVQAGSGGEP